MSKKDIIKSVSYNQHKIIKDIADLYNNGDTEFDLDITYSEGKFYGGHNYVNEDGEKETLLIKQPKYKCDVAPQFDDVIAIDPWGSLPFDDGSIQTIFFDPPFIISPRTCPSLLEDTNDNCKTFRRFSGYYPVNELLDSYKHWMEECFRILKDGGYMFFKCQPTVTGSKELNSHHWIWFVAESLGFDLLDEFVLLTKQRLISGKVDKQQHARKFHSYFYVLKKSTKKKIPYLNFMKNEEITVFVNSFIENNKGRKNGENLKYRNEIKPQTHVMTKNEKEKYFCGKENEETDVDNDFPDYTPPLSIMENASEELLKEDNF